MWYGRLEAEVVWPVQVTVLIHVRRRNCCQRRQKGSKVPWRSDRRAEEDARWPRDVESDWYQRLLRGGANLGEGLGLAAEGSVGAGVRQCYRWPPTRRFGGATPGGLPSRPSYCLSSPHQRATHRNLLTRANFPWMLA